MDLLAVYPADPDVPYFEKMPPLGMLWLGGELRRAGFGVHVIDEQVDGRDVGRVAEELGPALTLIGGTSHSRFASFAAAARAKEAFPPTVTVYGGPHASFAAEDTLQHISAIDIVVRGEGERTCIELAKWATGGVSVPN